MRGIVMEKLLIVTTTFTDKEEAFRVAETLLNQKLAACAQVSGEIESIYWWKNEIVRSDEYLLTLKTHENLYTQVESLIKEIHSYETPQIIGVHISRVDSDYRQWLCEEVCQEEK
jgi:periplasmic divalent cation tolerance protein